MLESDTMTDTEVGGRTLVERAFSSIRPSRLRRLFQRHEAQRQPSQQSERLSEPPEYRVLAEKDSYPESKGPGKSVNKCPSQENGDFVGCSFSDAEPNKVDAELINDPTRRAYVADGEHGAPPYTGGPSRIIVTSDGTRDCLAFLLTRDIVTSMNEMLSGTSKVSELEEKVDDLNREITRAEISLEQYAAMIEALPERPGKADEETKIRKEMKETEERSQQAANSRTMLEESLRWDRRNLDFSRDKIREVFKEALSESRLLEVDEQSAEMEEGQPMPSETQEPQSPEPSILNVETIISTDELNRRVTYEELETCRQHFHSLKDEFKNREAFYDSEFRDYQEAIADGSCVVSQSEFDRIFVRNISVLTRALIDAEAAYEDALRRARALRIIGNDFDQESDFVDHADDGYRESFEADMAAGADRVFIHQWMEVTEESENQEDDPLIDETDEWNARPVEISDSISMVAEGRDRVRIDRWYRTCGL